MRQPIPKNNIIQNIKEEHHNRTQWMDENLTWRERARIEREVAIKLVMAFLFYLTIMGLMWFLL